MTIKHACTVTCDCKFTATRDSKYGAISALIKHIRSKHPDKFKTLEKAGREHAKGQNGCGYWDDGKPSGDGWHKASSGFRMAHIMNALSYKLGDGGL